jgi:hypothetical protein
MPTVVNKKAPTVATDYDLLGGRDSMAEYYKLKLEELRSEKISDAGFLSEPEKKALQMTSDLDILTTKVLAKLKVLSDYDPVLNTMRALTGHEDRSDIARELATRHYNKSVTDHFVGKFVDVGRTDRLLGFDATGGGGLNAYRANLDGGLSGAAAWGGLARAVEAVVPGAGAAGNA